jgi:membrane-associated phospholipid phosphatase
MIFVQARCHVAEMRAFALRMVLLLLLLPAVATAQVDGVIDTVTPKIVDTLRGPLDFDEQLLLDINALGTDSTPVLDFSMAAITHSIYVTTIAVPGGLYALGWGEDDHEMAVAGMNAALSEVTAGMMSMTIKAIIRRNRPYRTLRGVRIPTGEEIGYSFPSGHSSVSWALATSLMISYPKWYVIVPAATYATLVGLSRPYVGVHYPTDIAAGAVVGAGSAFLIYALEPLITKNFPGLFPAKKETGAIQTMKIAEIKIPF